jgi:hypothetical protein
MSDRFKRIGDGFGPLLKELEQRALATQDLTSRVREALPEPEKQHFLSASYREDTLLLSMDSAAWCSRLRYDEHKLIAALRSAGETRVTKIKVRVGRG